MDGLTINAEDGRFILKDIMYDVTDVSIYTEFFDSEIIMSIDLEAETKENVDYEFRRVRLYHEDGFITHTTTFKELKGKKFDMEFDPDSDENSAGSLCVLEHEDITRGTIEILDVTDDKITIRWSGFANVYANEMYGENVPFDTVFTADIPKKKLHRMDLFKTASMKIDSSTVLDVLNLEEFNRDVEEVFILRQRNNFKTVLKFKVRCGNRDYFGEVIFENELNNNVTCLDEKCPLNVRLVKVNFNFRSKYEEILFEIN